MNGRPHAGARGRGLDASEYAFAAGLLLAVFSFIFAQPMFAMGVSWPDVEAAIVALHFGAALCAGGFAGELLLGKSRLDGLLHQPTALAALALALWSAAVAPFQALPWLSLLGAPENAQGALQFAEIAIFIGATLRLSRRLLWRRRVGVAVVLAAWGAAALQLVPQTRTEVFSEYLAYFGLAAMTAGYVFFPHVVRRWPHGATFRVPRPLVGTIAGLPVLLVSTNRTAIAIVLAVAFLVLVAWRIGLFAPGPAARRLRLFAAVLALLLPLVALAGIYLFGLDLPIQSIRSRALLLKVMLSQIAGAPATLGLGIGWGQTSSIFETHLSAASVAVWRGSWDAAQRDIFHSHNEILEALLAAGLPGAVGALTLCVAPILAAPRRLLPIAILFGLSLAGLDALWFQLPFTVAPVAVAYGALARRPRARRRSILGHRVAVGLAGALALAEVAAAAHLLLFGLAVNEAIASDNLPRDATRTCAQFPAEDWRANVELADIFTRAYQTVGGDLVAGRAVDAERYRRLLALFCEADRRAALGLSPYLMLVTLVFRGELAFAPGFAAAQPALDISFTTWRSRLLAFLNVAPLRGDVAFTYFGWLLQRGDTQSILRDAEILLQRNPADPVALWFSGVALLQTEPVSPAAHQLAVVKLRAALAAGIEKVMPIDPEIRNKITN